jgi:opacity protein-like surface antigen
MNKHYVVFAFLLACATPSLSAADLGFYVGLEAGQGRTELDQSDSTFVLGRGVLLDASSDREDQTFGLYGGYRFTEHFGIEVAYADLGEASFTTLRDVPVFFASGPMTFYSSAPAAAYSVATITALQQQTTVFESEALSMAIIGRYEFGMGFSVIGRAGLAIHQIESSLRFSLNGQPLRVIGGEDKASAGAGLLGLGVEWSFHPSWAVRLQANRHLLLEDEVVIDVDRGDVTTFTGGIEYRF